MEPLEKVRRDLWITTLMMLANVVLTAFTLGVLVGMDLH